LAYGIGALLSIPKSFTLTEIVAARLHDLSHLSRTLY